MSDKIKPFDHLIEFSDTEKLWWAEGQIEKYLAEIQRLREEVKRINGNHADYVAETHDLEKNYLTEMKRKDNKYLKLHKLYLDLLKNRLGEGE